MGGGPRSSSAAGQRGRQAANLGTVCGGAVCALQDLISLMLQQLDTGAAEAPPCSGSSSAAVAGGESQSRAVGGSKLSAGSGGKLPRRPEGATAADADDSDGGRQQGLQPAPAALGSNMCGGASSEAPSQAVHASAKVQELQQLLSRRRKRGRPSKAEKAQVGGGLVLVQSTVNSQ